MADSVVPPPNILFWKSGGDTLKPGNHQTLFVRSKTMGSKIGGRASSMSKCW